MRAKDLTKPDQYIPTMKLRRYVYALLSEECKGNHAKAVQMSGVSKQWFYEALKKNPQFAQWFSEQSNKFIASLEPMACYALMRNLLAGSDQAIRTFFQMRRKLSRDQTNVVDARGAHIGDKNETHVTNIEGNDVVVEAIEGLPLEKRRKLAKAIRDAGLITGES